MGEGAAGALTRMGAVELAALLRAGELSAREVAEAHIARIEQVDPLLNAVVARRFERARAEADAADAARGRGERLPPLHGVPFTVKELFDVEGLPTTAGLTARAGHRAPRDAPLVARLRAAGAILLGKTNVPALGAAHETENPVYGRTRNPWDPGRSPGGSSGGEAAIIAAGGSALGLGSDVGGSIRQPAHCCGIHGLKPTSGRLTMAGHWPVFPGQEAVLCQPGPLARRVADLEAALSILAAPGQEAFDPSVPPVPPREPAAVEPGALRVALFTDSGVFPAAPALRRAVEEAGAALEALGARVEPWSPPDVEQAMRLYLGLLFADGMAGPRRAAAGSRLDRMARRLAPPFRPPRALLRMLAAPLRAAGQGRAARAMAALGEVSVDRCRRLAVERDRYVARFLASLDAGGFDAILCPPDALPALTHGSCLFLDIDAPSYQQLFNLLGMPAGVVAATRVRPGEESDRAATPDLVDREARRVEEGSAGLPVGVQVATRHWREDVVLAVMAALERHFRSLPDYPAVPPLPEARAAAPRG